MKLFLSTIIATSLVAVGCNKQEQASNEQSFKQEENSIKKSAKAAKDDIEDQARARKEQVEAQAKAAEAQVAAQKAKLKAESAKASSQVEANSQRIQDAGNAGAKIDNQTGSDQSNSSTADQSLTEKVRTALKGESADANSESLKNITVTVANGVVTLKGTVKSDTDKTQFEQKAKSVSGVSQVDNQLKVKAE